MREDRLSRCVGDFDGRANHIDGHRRYLAMSHDGAGEELDAIAAHRQRLLRESGCICWSCGLLLLQRVRQLWRKINWNTVLGENGASGGIDLRTSKLSAFHPASQGESVLWKRANVEDGGVAPLGEHGLHVLFELGRRGCRAVAPDVLSEVHMAVPETGGDDPPA